MLFRSREADGHGLQVFDVATGEESTLDADGVITAAAIDSETVVAVEEPVAYHDESERRGTYRLVSDDLR